MQNGPSHSHGMNKLSFYPSFDDKNMVCGNDNKQRENILNMKNTTD